MPQTYTFDEDCVTIRLSRSSDDPVTVISLEGEFDEDLCAAIRKVFAQRAGNFHQHIHNGGHTISFIKTDGNSLLRVHFGNAENGCGVDYEITGEPFVEV